MSQSNFNIFSMTAFAKLQENHELGRFSWEVRSVNQRYLEINPRLPDAFRHLESELRNSIKGTLHRGKVDVSLSFENTISGNQLQINHEVLTPLVQAISEVQQSLPEATQVSPLDILKWPGVMQTENKDVEQTALDKILISGLNSTLQQLQSHRLREGQALAVLINERVLKIQQHLAELKPRITDIVQEHTQKLKQRLTQIAEELDESRLHQEIALLAQKLDVSEELDRIQTHLNEVNHILTQNQAGNPVGRRLDFLMQELNREANTLGSKSTNSQLTQTSVELKVLIEQMREQVQNIE